MGGEEKDAMSADVEQAMMYNDADESNQTRSPAASTSTDRQPCKSQDPEKVRREEDASDSDDDDDTSPDHGEPDLDHDEAGEAVYGRDLDRELSRVGLPGSVSRRERRGGCEELTGALRPPLS